MSAEIQRDRRVASSDEPETSSDLHCGIRRQRQPVKLALVLGDSDRI